MTVDKKQTGFTLIESIAAIVVLGLAIPPLVFLFQQVSVRSVDTTYQKVAVTYAESLMEEIVSKAYEDPDETTGSFGTEEGSRAAYDDTDDFDGLSNSPPQRIDGTPLNEYSSFTRSVTVSNVTAVDPDPGTPQADGSTEFKRVSVTVAWTGGQGGEMTLITLRSLLAAAPSGGADGNPIDEVASVATAAKDKLDQFVFDLFSNVPTDVVIASFSLSADRAMPALKEFELDDEEIWKQSLGLALPTGTVALNRGSTSDRTVSGGDNPEAEIEFVSNPTPGPAQYTLVLDFTNGSSSTLTFTITW